MVSGMIGCINWCEVSEAQHKCAAWSCCDTIDHLLAIGKAAENLEPLLANRRRSSARFTQMEKVIWIFTSSH